MTFSPRWVIFFFGLAFLFLVAWGVWFYTSQERVLWHETEETLLAIANLQVDRIVRWRADRLMEATELSERPLLTGRIARWMVDSDKNSQDLIHDILVNLRKNDHHCDVLLVDVSGQVRLSVNSGITQLDDETARLLKIALQEQKPLLSDLHLKPDGTQPHICAVAPILLDTGETAKPAGAFILQTDAKEFLYPILQSWPTPSKTAETLLVRRDGDDVLFLNDVRHQTNTALRMRIPLTQTDLPAVKAVLGHVGVVRGVDYRGVEVVSILKPIPDTPWFMVTKIDIQEAFASWRVRSILILGILLVTLLAITALAYAAWVGFHKEQLTILFKTEQQARESEARFRTLFTEATEGIALADAETGELLDFNQAFLKLSGYEKDELLGQPQRILHPEEPLPSGFTKAFEQHRTGGQDNIYCVDLVTKTGHIKQVEIKASTCELSGRKVIQGFFRDVTEELRHQNERETTLRLLRLLNEANNIHDLIRNLTELLQEWTGCDAVGVRLREGEDFPYFETRGFPVSFVEAERYLCARDQNGEVLRSPDGNILLECMCGNILNGHFDPSLPFFTPKGSFWTNSTSELLATTTEAERQTRTRNRCNGEGYESVALIPLKHGAIMFGLLQINSYSKNRLSLELLAFLESVADQIAIALAQQKAQQSLRESEQKFKTIVDWTYDWETWMGSQGELLYVSPSVERVTGYTPEDFYANPNLTNQIVYPDDQASWNNHLQDRLQDVQKVNELEMRIIDRQGNVHWIQHLCRPVFDSNGVSLGWRVSNRDITEHKHSETERERLALAIDQASEVVVITDEQGRIQYVNPAFEIVTGYTREEALGQTPRILKSGVHDQTFYREMWETLMAGRTWEGTMVNKRKDGSLFTEVVSISPVRDSSGVVVNYVAVERDITEQLHLVEEKESLQVQLLQAQKMEAVGRLAGGVAHDFNNMLQTILGYTSFALKEVPQEGFLRDCLEEVQKAGQRSADLTRQLLAFARKQTANPKILDLNDTLAGMLKMLQRLIGEDINLTWVAGHHLWRIRMDPSQIDQVLANLAVNARDAIKGVGHLSIGTSNAVIDQLYANEHVDTLPGEYVCLTVSDDGCGMDRETVSRIFEPFFTTKPLGEGTGLGLATVYGIVKQNDGFINVYSEPGHGTTFRIYLPRFMSESETKEIDEIKVMPVGGTETILLVEDEESVLNLGRQFLEQLGYTVLAARTPEQAIQYTKEFAGEIHLLLSDVIMPDMNGKELSHELLSIRPSLKILFMSGYTADVIAHRGVLDKDVLFVQKPFSFMVLAAKVREALA